MPSLFRQGSRQRIVCKYIIDAVAQSLNVTGPSLRRHCQPTTSIVHVTCVCDNRNERHGQRGKLQSSRCDCFHRSHPFLTSGGAKRIRAPLRPPYPHRPISALTTNRTGDIVAPRDSLRTDGNRWLSIIFPSKLSHTLRAKRARDLSRPHWRPAYHGRFSPRKTTGKRIELV